MTWTILLTTPQHEFRVRDALIDRDMRALVPVQFRLSKARSGGALKRPLIPGYCFAVVEHWGHLQRIDGLRSRPVLMIDGRPAVLTQSVVDSIEALSRPLAALREEGRRFRPGDRIRVKVNAITELQAEIARITMAGNPVAVVELLGKRHEIVLSPDQIEAA